MINLSKERLILLTKIILGIIIVYTLIISSMKLYVAYQLSKKTNTIIEEIKLKKSHSKKTKQRVHDIQNKITLLNNNYKSKKELEEQISIVFERVSILDYNIQLLDTKKMCIDRYFLVTSITANSEEDKKSALSIISYLGNVHQNQENENLYFIDFINEKKR